MRAGGSGKLCIFLSNLLSTENGSKQLSVQEKGLSCPVTNAVCSGDRQLAGPGRPGRRGSNANFIPRGACLPSGLACSRWLQRGPRSGLGSIGPARLPPSGPRSPGDSPPGSSCGEGARLSSGSEQMDARRGQLQEHASQAPVRGPMAPYVLQTVRERRPRRQGDGRHSGRRAGAGRGRRSGLQHGPVTELPGQAQAWGEEVTGLDRRAQGSLAPQSGEFTAVASGHAFGSHEQKETWGRTQVLFKL